MSKQIPVTNNTSNPLPVGGCYVMPGETRHFSEHQVPLHLRPAADKTEPEPPVDAVLVILDGSVPDVTQALPDLSDDELARLKAAEEGGKTRTGVMKAIAEEELKRASARTDAASKTDSE